MKVILTGAYGFLGWHTRVRLHALTDHEVVPVGRREFDDLPQLCRGADAIIHLAGINRGTDDEVEGGNRRLARLVAEAVLCAGGSPRIIFANSIHSRDCTPYGNGKSAASNILAGVAQLVGADYVDVRLPNVFGEHCRPRYNSFVATFVDAVVNNEVPRIVNREVELLHAQSAAQCLIDALMTQSEHFEARGESSTVLEVYETLKSFQQTYENGDIPALITRFDIDLFNTFRAALFPEQYPIALTVHADSRGRLVETVRSYGGEGQTFVSTTRPGVTRGDHFHLHKIERFVVVAGEARISLRKTLTDEIVSFDVSGARPAVVDMPTLWVHNITNIGDTELVTLFWTAALFDPSNPDTFWESVSPDDGVNA